MASVTVCAFTFNITFSSLIKPALIFAGLGAADARSLLQNLSLY